MAKGRKTGGRVKGTPNRKTVAAQAAATEAGRVLAQHLGANAFPGDAHALAMAIYKDMSQPIELRLEALKAALPYEKPRLSAVEHTAARSASPMRSGWACTVSPKLTRHSVGDNLTRPVIRSGTA